MNEAENKTKGKRSSGESLVDPAATNNLVGFFALLLEVDRRNNPDIYKARKAPQSDA